MISCVLFIQVGWLFCIMIPIFNDQYSFLSNFYLADIKYKGHVYKSAEHLYQALKCLNERDREKIRNASTPRAAKILGRFIMMRPEWERRKALIMEKVLRMKFRKNKLRRMLRETGEKELAQYNFWHDKYWSICTCTTCKRSGLNLMGVILMKIRSEINK